MVDLCKTKNSTWTFFNVWKGRVIWIFPGHCDYVMDSKTVADSSCGHELDTYSLLRWTVLEHWLFSFWPGIILSSDPSVISNKPQQLRRVKTLDLCFLVDWALTFGKSVYILVTKQERFGKPSREILVSYNLGLIYVVFASFLSIKTTLYLLSSLLKSGKTATWLKRKTRQETWPVKQQTLMLAKRKQRQTVKLLTTVQTSITVNTDLSFNLSIVYVCSGGLLPAFQVHSPVVLPLNSHLDNLTKFVNTTFLPAFGLLQLSDPVPRSQQGLWVSC